MSNSDELLDVFREEAQDLLDKMASLTKKLLGRSDEEFNENHKLLAMAVHNLKGAASTVNFVDMTAICHAIEDTLELLKADSAALSEDMVDSILEAITLMYLSLEGEDIQDKKETLFPLLRDQTLQKRDISKVRLTSDTKKAKSAAESKEHIRVDSSRLDHLMEFTGVLLESGAHMGVRNDRWNGFIREIQKQARQDKKKAEALLPVLSKARLLLRKDYNDLLDFVNLVQEMSDAMKQMRMVPLKNVESMWRKTVRDAAHKSQKKVDLQIEIGKIEIDKQVLEQLRDPMMHILRNAVDHGIEALEKRVAKGKKAQGRIKICARVRGARLHFNISDDGRGIDYEDVYRKALDKGMFAEGDEKSQEQIQDILFDPGFSTASNVSSLSGRGVGLAVVRSQIEKLGGNVVVDRSTTTDGTTFRLEVPLSILSSFGLLVRSGETIFALPLENISRTLRVFTDNIEYVYGMPLISQDDGEEPLRLVWLAEIMGTKPSINTKVLAVVILQRSNVQMALVVDEVVGQREFVTKALPWNFTNVPGVNGAIIQEDGSVAISLDVPFLFESARNTNRSKKFSGSTISVEEKKIILLVDDSMSSLTLGRSFLEAAGYIVLTAVDGIQAWEQLQQSDFDLVVSDVNMPNMDGLELTRRIRQNTAFRDLPVILVTSKAQPEDIAAGAEAGADEYVIKGTFDQQNLVDLVSKYL